MGKKEKEEGTCSRRRVCLERRKKEQDGERNLKKRGGRAGNRVDGGSQHGGNKPRRGDVYFRRV